MPLLFINGASHQTGAADLETLFLELGFPAPLMLVEYNGTALSRSEWDKVMLTEGDRLELLSVAAGG